MAEWNVLAGARQDFADMLDELSEEQLQAQSLCEKWRVIDVAGHLVSVLDLSPMAMVKGMAKNRGDLDQWFEELAIEFADLGAPAIAQSLRDNAWKKMRLFPEASMVADTAVHTLDVRRPLGLETPLDADVLAMALDYGVGEFAKKGEAVRFVANDMDWSAGSGPEVHGTGEALLMALHNRDVSAELDGEGVTLLG